MPGQKIQAKQVSTATVSTVGTANAEGSGQNIARADHVHDHGAQTSGTLHASAMGGSANGFQPQSNAAAADPTATDDSSSGYSIGSRWVNTTSDEEFVCCDATATAAVWKSTTSDVSGLTPRQESVTTETITGTDTALADTLDNTPTSNAAVVLFLNGVYQEQGAGKDYSISGTTITWLAATGTAVDMATTDVLDAHYQS